MLQKKKPIIIAVCVLLTIAILGVSLWLIHVHRLRASMDEYFEEVTSYINSGDYQTAILYVENAKDIAVRLRDEDGINLAINITQITNLAMRGDELFSDSEFTSAVEFYSLATDFAESIADLNLTLLNEKIATSETFIAFYELIDYAEELRDSGRYKDAIAVYNRAQSVAAGLSYSEGVSMTESGVARVEELIILAERARAEGYIRVGNQLYVEGSFTTALSFYNLALGVFTELEDAFGIFEANNRITSTEQRIAELASARAPAPAPEVNVSEPSAPVDIPEYPTEEESNLLGTNYERNLQIDFDLQTPIDHQGREPASLIRMGSVDGRNEGWYNGCGWVAVYNALIHLGAPSHPANIVRDFENYGGTVFDGVFGSHPNAIVRYLENAGFGVNHTLLPQLTFDLDEAIRSSQVGILAYMHTTAAHYITIVYREDINMFVVYNDGFARTRSAELGLQAYSEVGAVIDSVNALVRNTRNILFSFSLITVP